MFWKGCQDQSTCRLFLGSKGRPGNIWIEGFTKPEFHPIQQEIKNKRRRPVTLSTAQDGKFLVKLRHQAIPNANAMSKLVHFKPFVGPATTQIFNRRDTLYAEREGDAGVCDFDTWFQFYAFVVIGGLTYFRGLGFADPGGDLGGIIGDH